ncbi:DUF5060 domain-containing protein [Hirschia litorea]|uniref:DUF5060 domain-containing protein n=1 Tax=Hirschia litorea TaxID=1199156 RepID=A0ABW2IQE0_9PROT
MKAIGIKSIVSLILSLSLLSCASLETDTTEKGWAWENVEATGTPTARHEAALAEHDGKLYLLGGRRINAVDVFDPASQTWTQKSKTPLEIHHFQAVTVGDAIYIIGAMTGQWPKETPLDKILIYYPKTDRFEYGDTIPKARRRGGAGAVYKDGKIYLVGGITNGHMDGYVNWFDSYDIETGKWTILPDAPHKRDHFQAVVSNDKLFAFGGRRSEQRAGLSFEQTVIPGDVFNFQTNTWEETRPETAIPTKRAGNSAIAIGDYIVIGGGESSEQVAAHDEVEIYDSTTQEWKNWPDLLQGRHGTGFAIVDDYLYTISGCGQRGGEPELSSIERLKIPSGLATSKEVSSSIEPEASPVMMQPDDTPTSPKLWHTFELDFEGPETSETAPVNPFTDYRLLVEFSNGETSYLIRGFYAADGDAGNTSAKSGNIWRARFTPDTEGEWTYKASLKRGARIAINRDPSVGENIEIANPTGSFHVGPSDATGKDFRAPNRGRLKGDGKLFRFEKSGQYWLKGGPASPENMLGYVGFDDTYRLLKEAREGEASAEGEIHAFAPHRKDWKAGDPLWGWKTGEPRGHSLIGAINYIAEKGMNTIYFLTLNIKGDGNDVWPYESPHEFDRFDVSKLAQWNVVFDHMQAKGILLHVVTQETENERMLDGGDTEFFRKLYYSELISRFGHHPALIWNLGEENGPSSWMKVGQSHAQRKEMARFFDENDPYDHTVLLHSHAQHDDINWTFTPLLGFKPLDGMSLQIDEASDVYESTKEWHERSAESGHQWLITLDEIGPWYNGALPDDVDPDHDNLRRHVLWGHLLAGGAGVEWFFGGKYHSNDVSTEDWRTRDNLWTQTAIALNFFEDYLPYWKMGSCGSAMGRLDVYCLGIEGEIYAFYQPGRGSHMLTLPENETGYSVSWFNPKLGGELQTGSVTSLESGSNQFVGFPPDADTQDWVLLVKKK